MKMVRLGDISSYVNDKIKANNVLIDEFIATDNMLQNKQGVKLAVIPPLADSKITHFKKNDILIANIRPYLKKIWYADFDGGCSSDVLVIRANQGIDNQFLYYALFRNDFFDFAMKGAKGTKMPRGDKKQMMNFKIPDMDLKTQQSIAHILSLLDQKIALNHQINAQLENLAKTLYDYWFVQFDFPDKNGKPYRSSGGEMVYDKTLKREIPKGWNVGKLGDVANTGSGGTPKSDNLEYYENGNIAWINSGELNDSIIVNARNFITELGVKNSNAKLFPKNTILLAMYGATAGKSSLLTFSATTNQAICAIMPKNNSYLIYLKVYFEKLQDYLINLSSGSARDNLSQDKIRELKILIPNETILNKFCNKVDVFFDKTILNKKQNQQLTQLRDFLLPMLMNGQVVCGE